MNFEFSDHCFSTAKGTAADASTDGTRTRTFAWLDDAEFIVFERLVRLGGGDKSLFDLSCIF